MAFQHLVKGEADWHEKINRNFDQANDMMGKIGVTVRVDDNVNKNKWYEVMAQDLTDYTVDDTINMTFVVGNGAGIQLGLLNVKLNYINGVITPWIGWAYGSGVDMNDYAIEVVDRKWRLCTFIKATEMVKTFELIARSSANQIGLPSGMPIVAYEEVVTRYIQSALVNPVLSKSGTDASTIMYGEKSLDTVLGELNSSLNSFSDKLVPDMYNIETGANLSKYVIIGSLVAGNISAKVGTSAVTISAYLPEPHSTGMSFRVTSEYDGTEYIMKWESSTNSWAIRNAQGTTTPASTWIRFPFLFIRRYPL